MSGVELGLGILGAIDVCYRYGKALLETCQAFHDADSRLGESALRVEVCWMRIESQLHVVRKLAPSLDERHRDVQQRTLEVLLNKLRMADLRLAKLTKSPDSQLSQSRSASSSAMVEARRWKFALMRDGIAEAIADLEAWQALFDPAWFLMMKMASPEVDNQLEMTRKELPHASEKGSSSSIPAARDLRRALKPEHSSSGGQSTVFLPQDGLAPSSVRAIHLSTASTAQRVDNGHMVVLDPINCTSRPHVRFVLKDAREFAKRLKRADPSAFGMLECKGILQEEGEKQTPSGVSRHAGSTSGLSFVFRLPSEVAPLQSLRHRLVGGHESRHDSLSERFALARQLVAAVSYVHIFGFVHKNIRPETVLLLRRMHGENREGRSELVENAVLVGFDVLRGADERTRRVSDEDWEKNLYRHPTRQGRMPEVDYEMRHDIYSVGVCLLEIGLWENFVAYEDGDLVPMLGPGLASDGAGEAGTDLLRDPVRLKGRLQGLARGKLRRNMGTLYSEVVETCLTCLDEGNLDFGDEEEFQDEDGIAVDVRYIEKVVAKLGSIAI
ncbi:hypothetical protein B0I35DRAFT_275439 [Stachybotrys elegans]|uniref:Protein kinase domain-containing protein n=1 Tax=Stachybotrys elegans TaxID=80388 RepID=A0A8K0SS32_9HYPO|nr:hypothetical protein B0I35DRAFT_275439 [Stachybotrys elegans]